MGTPSFVQRPCGAAASLINLTMSTSSSNSCNPSSHSAFMASQQQKQPQNVSEWQLNLVLQRANLLQYYDTFISQGGDDVQQLLEAGEEEFLEIMALVGMASKPLHVRRLQKALQEYSTNPVAFQLMAFQKSGVAPPPGLAGSAASLPPLLGAPFGGGTDATTTPSVSPGAQYAAAVVAVAANTGGCYAPLTLPAPSTSFNGAANSESPGALSTHTDDGSSAGNPWMHGALPDGLDVTFENYALPSTTAPCLTEAQVQRISEFARILAATLPDLEPKLVQNKKKVGRELLQVMETADVGARLDQCRKFARIYGRFDAKRKADKPLTLHEVSVNEAAAQICLHRPALLTRRDELFPLARQVVRDAGYLHMRLSPDQKRRSSPPESICSDFEGSPAPSTSTASELSPEGSAALHAEYKATAVGTIAGYARRPSLSLLSALPSKKKRCLREIGEDMQKVGRQQDLCKMRVAEAADLVELHAIQRDLHRLTQRQMELSDEQADALQVVKKESTKIGKSGFEICNIFNIKRENGATPPNGAPRGEKVDKL